MNPVVRPIQQFIRLRLLVSFLGEKRQASWWDCGFLDATGTRFLETIFPRTFRYAAVRSTTEAARLVHDSKIGRVGIFHLFRLPVDIEDQLEACVPESVCDATHRMELTTDSALEELGRYAKSSLEAPHGPVQIGTPEKILTATSVSDLAAHYHSAFKKASQCFPYFAQTPNVKR
jgi:hypothetical protein